ncbi:MAG: hypothetical protein KKG25_11080 [Bacteroidetes bacterium]|nr:hypothetical protein [Bacteroidota bacterium]MBU1485387.1 hypothetical protein [Bacteroidota bacterium]MBU1759846.1 hypothetical protein [Bacteroidota bacterium]MBU2267907.1 hypothetical protein [Bacteroidota bacterium]MBU2376486.1 hypothetical protein [Bacteroidota bacterium]
MKTKKKAEEKEFDTVKTFRQIKDSISKDLTGKSTAEILEYLRINSLKLQSGK